MVDREASATEVRDDLGIAREWLREYALHNGVDVSVLAEEQMLRLGMSLMDVNYVLENGNLVFCEPDAVGCEFMIAGETCDDHVLEVCGKLSAGNMVLEIESVKKVG